MNRTKIPYLDYTCNPITGCSGDGCAVRKRCWALAMAKRLKGRYGYPSDDPFKPTFHEDKLYQPFNVGKPSIVGLCFMGDFFDKGVLLSWQQKVLRMVEGVSWHTFFILTKQPQNASQVLPNPYLDNLWIGVSVNQKRDIWRIDELKKVPAEVHAVSFEPLYEDMGNVDLKGIDWVIIGAQTRPKLLPKRKWVHELASFAWNRTIPVFLKNNLGLKNPVQEFPRVAT